MKALLVMSIAVASATAAERVLTHTPAGHLIHNSQVFSRDGRFIVFDSRNDETQLASSSRIGIVEVVTGKETTIYEVSGNAAHGPGVGAATFSPMADEVVFIHGLDNASADAPYAAYRRSAARVSLTRPEQMERLDARDITEPFRAGALRGGTHAHHWSGDGKLLSFTYNDALIRGAGPPPDDLRTVGIMLLNHPVEVNAVVPGEEFSGNAFAMLVVPVKADPASGSDELLRACEEGWVGTRGYERADGSRQEKSLAFIGTVVSRSGQKISEVFVVDLPPDLMDVPMGTPGGMPAPPKGTVIRRLTRTAESSRPGLQGPRHWLRASPDGSLIAFLDEDDKGVVQIHGVSPVGGAVRLLSKLEKSVDTPFTWSPDGRLIGCSSGGRVTVVDVRSGEARFLTGVVKPQNGVVFSPDGKQLAYNRRIGGFLQICMVDVGGS